MAIQTWGKQIMGVAAALAFLGLSPEARAIISVDATFSDGALPSDFGFAGGGTVAPAGNVDTNAGVWNNTLTGGNNSFWSGGTGSVATITGPIIYGRAFVQALTFSGQLDEVNLVALGRDMNNSSLNLGFLTSLANGNYQINTGGGTVNVPVANTSGQHIYGWELDTSARTVKLFFDDTLVGGPYNVGNNTFVGSPDANNDSFFYFGDATGGEAHSEVWDRWVVQEGAYVPEPSAVVLLGVGGLILVRRRMNETN